LGHVDAKMVARHSGRISAWHLPRRATTSPAWAWERSPSPRTAPNR